MRRTKQTMLTHRSLTRHWPFLALILTVAWLIGCSSAPTVTEELVVAPQADMPTGTFTRTLTHDEVERTYIVHIPEQINDGEPLPLLLNLHGYTGSAESQMGYADFRPIADREGVVVIYPEGTLLRREPHWNVDGLFDAIGLESETDDLGFFTALLDQASADFNIDTSRVYAIGHSNGGYMSIHLACQMGDRITAVASISGTMTPETMAACQPTHPTPLLQIHGTADRTVPYDGASWTVSVEDVLDYWIEFNVADADSSVVDIPPSDATTQDSTVSRVQFSSAAGDVMVEHIMVENGGHEWLNQASRPLGPVNVDLDANEAIWAFLAQFDLDDLR